MVQKESYYSNKIPGYNFMHFLLMSEQRILKSKTLSKYVLEISDKHFLEKQESLSQRPQMLPDYMLSLLTSRTGRSFCTFQRIYLVITNMLGHIQRKGMSGY